jgi:hypothetical protein
MSDRPGIGPDECGRVKTMRVTAGGISVVAGIVGLIGSAVAADMSAADIKAFAIGKTVYLETTAASVTGTAGQGIIPWAEDGTAIYKTPMGAMWTGTWQIKGDMLCTEWKQRPPAPCGRWDKTGDAVSINRLVHRTNARQSGEDRAR